MVALSRCFSSLFTGLFPGAVQTFRVAAPLHGTSQRLGERSQGRSYIDPEAGLNNL